MRLSAKYAVVKNPNPHIHTYPTVQAPRLADGHFFGPFIIHPYKSIFTSINPDFTAHFTGSGQIYLTFPSFYFPTCYFSLFQPDPSAYRFSEKPVKNKNRTNKVENWRTAFPHPCYYRGVISSILSPLPLHQYTQIPLSPSL